MNLNQVVVVGAGLLGGSIGLALKERGLAQKVGAWVRREETVSQCLESGAFDHASLDPEEVFAGADFVILCVPVARMAEVYAQMQPHLPVGCIVTDVGSVKTQVIEDLRNPAELGSVRFVGSHPMAGSERSGLSAAAANLFAGRVCALTPTDTTDAGALEAVEGFWRALGMATLQMTPERHDAIVASCSHLPHVISAALILTVFRNPEDSETRKMSGSGLRDTSRLASGSPEMWRDISMGNREKILAELEMFSASLGEFQEILRENDADALMRYFDRAKSVRDGWLIEKDGTS